jgi:GNAT superfamily N-acetyltransferase
VLYSAIPTEFVIRSATGADSRDAVQIVQTVFQEYGWTWDPDDYCADLYDLAKHYLGQGHYFWMAEKDGRAIATAGLKLFPLLRGTVGEAIAQEGITRAAGCDASLERLYVLPPYRRQGVGAALFEAALGTARARNCQAMEIWSDKRLADAHRLYARYGARIVGDRICCDPDQSPEWGMALPLT